VILLSDGGEDRRLTCRASRRKMPYNSGGNRQATPPSCDAAATRRLLFFSSLHESLPTLSTADAENSS